MSAHVLLCTALCVAQVDAAAGRDLDRAVAMLVEQLNVPQLAEREQAERALLEMGPVVLDHLPAVGDRTPAEVKQRLVRVREALERRRAEEFATGARVTLSGRMPLSQVLAALQQQTGNAIVDYRDEFGQGTNDVEVDVDFDKTLFWEALDRVLDDAQLTAYAYAGENGIAIINRGQMQYDRHGPAAYFGAFRVETTQLRFLRELRSGNPGTLTLQFEVAWEPRVRPIAIKQRMDDVRAVDDTGAVIELDDTMAEFEARIDPGSFSTLLELPLVPPSRAAQRMASISGKLTVILPGGIERFRFENLAGARLVEQRKGSATVTLEQVRKNNDVWEIRVLVRYDEASPALESHRGWIFNNPAYLVGADGERVQYDGFETTRQSEDEVGMAYLFVLEKELDNYAFVYETPATLLTLPVEYKLTDIDLP